MAPHREPGSFAQQLDLQQHQNGVHKLPLNIADDFLGGESADLAQNEGLRENVEDLDGEVVQRRKNSAYGNHQLP